MVLPNRKRILLVEDYDDVRDLAPLKNCSSDFCTIGPAIWKAAV